MPNEIPPPPPGRSLFSTPWMDIAYAEAGVKEMRGDKHHPRIIEYLSTVTKAPAFMRDEVAWCSAFVNWVMCRYMPKGYFGHRARARAWMTFGCKVPLEQARFGDVVMFRRSVLHPAYHVAFFVRRSPGYVHAFGGNQNNAVCEKRYPAKHMFAVRRPPAPIKPQQGDGAIHGRD